MTTNSIDTEKTDSGRETERDLSVVDRLVEEHGRSQRSVIPILHGIQDHFRYLPQEALDRICVITDITPAQIEGVSTFYSRFRHSPVGDHLISVCHGTACHVAGAEAVTDSIRRYLDLDEDEDTDDDGRFTVEAVSCLGCCSLAPVMRIDNTVYGRLSPETAPRAVEKFMREGGSGGGSSDELVGLTKDKGGEDSIVEIKIGLGSCCIASGSAKVAEELERKIGEMGISAELRCAGCVGMCHRVPLVEFFGPGGSARYGGVTPSDVPKILRRHTRPKGVLGKARAAVQRLEEMFTSDAAWQPLEGSEVQDSDRAVCAFLGKQKHIVLEGCGVMDPVDIDDYKSYDGYQALERCVTEMEPEEVIETVKTSGLRGRGGGGFPTGAKWEQVRKQDDPTKYIIMNGDEGDPGAFMDRMLLESYPHRVLEGLTIAAYAVGAREAYLYVRAEYPLALDRLRRAIELATERGYLGQNICGTDFSLDVQIMEGAGAFVCGEETGLIQSLEGKRGMPRFRPPYPAEEGLWGHPTNINNVETYATVPWILRNGGEALAEIGTEKSKGTKVFALAGRIKRGGLIEVPMGITVGEIVDEIGGGIRDERTFKAVQVGGPSGGCIPASLRDVRIDYHDLQEHGAIMGSGGLVVMDDTTCMVDVAKYFLQFTQAESCGKCTFCRVGTKRMLEILERLTEGKGKKRDLEELEHLAHRVRSTSLCGLGKTAPNPILTTLRYFRDEYEAHLDGRCPAKKCKELIEYRITDRCTGCTLCAQYCPTDAIEIRPYEQHEIEQEKCVQCGTCHTVCPEDAVEVE